MQRLVPLDGCLNFRDLGGYPAADGRTVRWRRVFRSDALHLLTPGDVARIRDELGVRDVIDLRSSAEVRSEGQGPLAAHAVRFHHVPLFDAEVRSEDRERAAQITLADRYVFLAELAGERIARVVRPLADADTPAVYHCAAGKDRTGVISALLLGTPRRPGRGDRRRLRRHAREPGCHRRPPDARSTAIARCSTPCRPDTMHADPETMLEFLARLRGTHGSSRRTRCAPGSRPMRSRGLRETAPRVSERHGGSPRTIRARSAGRTTLDRVGRSSSPRRRRTGVSDAVRIARARSGPPRAIGTI